MHRQLIAFCAAATTALAIPVFAQTERAPVSKEKEITLTGCVQKNKSGGYWLTNATIGDFGDDEGRQRPAVSDEQSDVEPRNAEGCREVLEPESRGHGPREKRHQWR
jgi:hypothetical protein